MAPLLDKEDCNSDPHHDADAHIAFLKTILKPLKRRIDCIRFLVGDNCSVNGSIASKLGVPLVGCASHRLNLAMTQYLDEYEDILEKINDLMKFLRGLNHKKTSLRPVIRQKTRWSSTFPMVERYFKLKPFLDSADGDLAAYMPSPLEERRLRTTLDDLKDFESVSKKLQEEGHMGNLTLADVRALFDSLMEKEPSLGSYLAPQAPIVKFPVFEMACYIPPTSNIAERFFSQAGIVLSPQRQAMAPAQLENILFLKTNRRFWNVAMVQKAGEQNQI
eukprot:jgi/Phyca11/133604/e_gw1.585.2.1